MAFSVPNVSRAQVRMLRMNLTAAIPLLATSTLWMGESPPSALQNSSTTDGEDRCLLLDILLGVPFVWSSSATIVATL
jgi:hypothetical protein